MDHHTAQTTSFKEIQIGKNIYRVTSFYSGEKDLGKTLETLALHSAIDEINRDIPTDS